MTATQIKTLGQCRQWHLERSKENHALGQTWRQDKVYLKHQEKISRLHKRFANAIEKCLPKPF